MTEYIFERSKRHAHASPEAERAHRVSRVSRVVLADIGVGRPSLGSLAGDGHCAYVELSSYEVSVI